jgi:transglutaminase-like putative cysteine protease
VSRDHPHLPLVPVAWTVAAFLVAAAPHLLAMPASLSLVVVLAAVWRLLGAHLRWRPPPGWLRIVLTLAALALLVIAYGGLWGRRAATGLLCLMLGAKMFELYRLRDLRMVTSISFFLVATQFLFDERLVYVAYLFASILVATGALFHIQQLSEGRPARSARFSHTIRDSAALIAGALPIALILFVTFPRLAEPLWGLPDEVMDGKTGLSESMSPGSISNLFIDDSPAFRAEFDSTPPPPQRRYWRGPVLWHFDGDTWERAFLASRNPAPAVPRDDDDYRYSIQLEPHERHWLFALDYPVTRPDDARVSLDFQMTTRHPVTSLKRYSVRSNPDYVDMPELPATFRRIALDLPEDRNPRTLEWAGELRERFDDDRALIDHLLDWFNREPFVYSLEAPPLGRHGVDEFLFDVREGYCEYYASAFAVVMRAAGIPARIVTGYQGGFWQEGAGYLLIRHSDAHAWVEVWLDGAGWVRVDPTAAVSPERIEQGAQSLDAGRSGLLDMPWIRDLRNRYDRLQHLWNEWVLGFDARRQTGMLRSLGLPDMSTTGLAIIMIAGLGVVLGGVAWAFLSAALRPRTRLERAWRRLERRMARRGLGRVRSETPMDWAERVAPELANRSMFETLVVRFCRLRYGPFRHRGAEQRFVRESGRYRPRRIERSSTASV